jgi:hypothetical protein
LDKETSMTKRNHRPASLTRFLLVAGITLAVPAFAAQPWVSVPSTSQNGQLVVSGGDLAPNSVVTVKITQPDGVVASQAVAAGANGKLQLQYPVGMPGSYGVKAYDAAGKLIGGGTMGHIR